MQVLRLEKAAGRGVKGDVANDYATITSVFRSSPNREPAE